VDKNISQNRQKFWDFFHVVVMSNKFIISGHIRKKFWEFFRFVVMVDFLFCCVQDLGRAKARLSSLHECKVDQPV
jgi:hypothetical protein